MEWKVLFDLGFGRNWNREFEGVNEEKRGRPYEFPDSYIEFLSFFRADSTHRTGS